MASCATILVSVCLLNGCTPQEPESFTSFGAEIIPEGAVLVSEVIGKRDMDGQNVKVRGTIREVCQTRGCWLTLDAGEGRSMRVTFRDYAYFVPMDAGGNQAIVEGTLKLEELSVETLRHFAEEAGRPQSEIEAINSPSEQLSIIADGVLIAGIVTESENATSTDPA